MSHDAEIHNPVYSNILRYAALCDIAGAEGLASFCNGFTENGEMNR